MSNIKFLGTVYLLQQVLPALSHLSQSFQGGNVSFAAIEPAIKFTIDEIKDVANQMKPLEQLKEDLVDGRLFGCKMTLGAHHVRILVNLPEKYAHSLVQNITNRFSNSLPLLTAFKIFDPRPCLIYQLSHLKSMGFLRLKF